MASPNEKMIRQIFDEVVRYRPALAKYLILDEDEEEDEIDFRILGDLLIKSFPWPLGIELRRLFSGSMRNLDRARLDQIFKTIERIMQFVCFVMLSQLWDTAKKKQLQIPDEKKSEFHSRLLLLTMGNYSWLIRAIGNLFAQAEIDFFMAEMADVLGKKFYNTLDFWVPERNEIGHYQINLTPEETEKRCVEYEEKLTDILKKLAFFAKYKLVSVREIQVVKPKYREASFRHVIDLLNSSDSDFRAKEVHQPRSAESHSVLLVKTIKSIDDYLNLSPLIIDTSSEILNTRDKFNIKKDIFLYTKYRTDHIFYLGTEVTEKCDLRSLSSYDLLLEEFNDLLTILA